jgi:hypothetical protein
MMDRGLLEERFLIQEFPFSGFRPGISANTAAEWKTKS